MAVYGPVCHPQNIIWTLALLRSINCHMALSVINYLYMTFVLYKYEMLFRTEANEHGES